MECDFSDTDDKGSVMPKRLGTDILPMQLKSLSMKEKDFYGCDLKILYCFKMISKDE